LKSHHIVIQIQNLPFKAKHYLSILWSVAPAHFRLQEVGHYIPNIVTIPTQKTSAVRSATYFVVLAAEATLDTPADDDEDAGEALPEASDEAPADELKESIGDVVVDSALKIVSTKTSPSLAVEVTTTSLLDIVSDASGEAVELASAAASTPAIPAHT
jgi:hypothetical protein